MAPTVAPHVACVMLTTNTRPKLMARAIRCFERQTYANRSLIIFNSGTTPVEDRLCCQQSVVVVDARAFAGQPIGTLRNAANSMLHGAQIICHWDDDDCYGPTRIQEQVETLRSTQYQVVGYNQVWFWREVEKEAWLYSSGQRNVVVGASLCYWKHVWWKNQFDSMPHPGEDTRWLNGKQVFGMSGDFWLIASIHEQNTSRAYDRKMMVAVENQGGEWKREAQMDEVIGKVMECK